MRIARTSIVLLLACGAAIAHATIRVDCESRFLDELDRLSEPDREVFGLKSRDWKPEHVDEWQRQSLACISAKRNWADAMKDSMRQAVTATAARSRTNLFALRDGAMRTGGLQNQVETSKLSQVVLYGDGRPESMTIRYERSGARPTETRTCRTLSQGIGLANAESYRQAIVFARMCAQTQQADASVAASLEKQAASAASLSGALDNFAGQVSEAARINPAPDARLKQLVGTQEHLLAQVKSLGSQASDATFNDAAQKLRELQTQLEQSACKDQFVKAGMPAAWKDHYIVLEFNSPEPFAGIVCAALRTGAQVRYLSGGLLGKEGFEVKSAQRTVQIFSEANRVAGGNPRVLLMVPVVAKIDGQKVEVTRGNLRAVAAELIAAMRNQ